MAEGSERYDQLVNSIKDEFPRFRVIKKSESKFQKLLHYGLVVVTLGRMRDYLDGYYTTIGGRLYVTDDWEHTDPDDRYVTLCHELIHMRQFRRYTPPLMGLLYLLIPLPMGLAYFRARFEKEAYAETLRATAECYGIGAIRRDGLRERILDQFTGASYGWMWPFRRHMERWYEAQCVALEDAAKRAEDEAQGLAELEREESVTDPVSGEPGG